MAQGSDTRSCVCLTNRSKGFHKHFELCVKVLAKRADTIENINAKNLHIPRYHYSVL